MNAELILKRRDGEKVKATIKLLDISYLDKILELQKYIYDLLEEKEFYSCCSEEDLKKDLTERGRILGCIVEATDELVAIGVYAKFGYNEENYGYDIGVKGEELLYIANFESTIVHPDYRGNKLQKILIEKLEELAKADNIKYICATAAPDNKYSSDNIKELGFEIVCEKEKYGGLRRYVFMKRI